MILYTLAGCVSTVKNEDRLNGVNNKRGDELCVFLKFYSEKKSINKSDYSKVPFYFYNDILYKNSLKRWNITTDCSSPSKEYEVVYRYVTDTSVSNYIWFASSVLTARLIPYWSNYSVEIQMKSTTTSKVVINEKIEVFYKASIFHLYESISQFKELRDRTGTSEVPDAFLIEKTAQLIIQSEL